MCNAVKETFGWDCSLAGDWARSRHFRLRTALYRQVSAIEKTSLSLVSVNVLARVVREYGTAGQSSGGTFLWANLHPPNLQGVTINLQVQSRPLAPRVTFWIAVSYADTFDPSIPENRISRFWAGPSQIRPSFIWIPAERSHRRIGPLCACACVPR